MVAELVVTRLASALQFHADGSQDEQRAAGKA
jgi:hypothetical protein